MRPSAALLLFFTTLSAADIQIFYSVIQSTLAAQAFTQDGRLYVRGKPGNCTYAFLENPAVTGQDGRLLVKAKFTGRSASSFLGFCVGLGDSFDLAIAAVPYYQDGLLKLREVKVESRGRETYYSRRVRSVLQDSLTRQFQYPVNDTAKKLLEDNTTKGPARQLSKFQVAQVRVTPEALVLSVDFTLTVK